MSSFPRTVLKGRFRGRLRLVYLADTSGSYVEATSLFSDLHYWDRHSCLFLFVKCRVFWNISYLLHICFIEWIWSVIVCEFWAQDDRKRRRWSPVHHWKLLKVNGIIIFSNTLLDFLFIIYIFITSRVD